MAINQKPQPRKKLLPPPQSLLEYRSARAYNREVSLLRLAPAFHAFATMDETSGQVSEILTSHRDRHGKTHVSLIKFMLLLQRQARTGFDAFVEGQAYQGWVLFRPGPEAALIIGKWLDDPMNAKVWQNRRSDWKAYRKAYEGKALRSVSLARSEQFQSVLKTVNDDFIHANPDYLARHVKVTRSGAKASNLWLMYFDDDATLQIQIFAFLHLYVLIIDSLLSAYKNLFPSLGPMQSGLAEFEAAFGPRIAELRKTWKDNAKPLTELGLWL